jgi:hypothetical protein
MNFSVLSGARSPFVVAAFLMLALFQPAIASAQNSPPQISGTPPTAVNVGARYYFRPTASDPDGDVLKFAISRKPFWASFDSTTGTLSGVPTAKNIGVYRDIKITVSDKSAIRALPRFSFTVTAATADAGTTNRAPVISGTPATSVSVGQAYLFQPTASDPDGNTLTFSVQNRPAWATFNTGTGRLYGTPGVTNVGTYSNITIGVSDGVTTSRLAPFAIAVAAAASNTATIRWTAPTTNTDGSPLTDLAGFRVSYGQAPGSYSYVLSTGSPSVTSVEIQGLTSGIWYFAVRAVNSRGVESTFSAERSKTL